MCTAINETRGRHIFGRTLDLECSWSERAVITPRYYEFKFRHESPLTKHFALIGIAHVSDGVPLYYDAANEWGLAAAGLNFGKSAKYSASKRCAHNIASFELIPWVLGQCKSVREAAILLENTAICGESFSADLPATPMHWLFGDATGAITAEPLADGLKVYDNPFGTLTNEPGFDYHLTNVKNYAALTPKAPHNTLCPEIDLPPYSRGMGALGLPGDFSSASRFVRAVFAKTHTLPEVSEADAVNRFFHVMNTVAVPRGCILTDGGAAVSTLYTSCVDTESLTYYFSTYDRCEIRSFNLFDAKLDSDAIFCRNNF